MSSVNCSYTDSGGNYKEQLCVSSQTYCCSSTDSSSYCSEAQCSTGSFSFSTIAFWAFLGGLLVLCSVVVGVAYAICYVRKPRGCASRNTDEQLIEETIHQEETTVTSHKHVDDGSPSIEIRTERVKTVTSRKRSRPKIVQGFTGDAIKINVTGTPEQSYVKDQKIIRPTKQTTFLTNQLGYALTGQPSPSTSTADLPSIS